MHESIPDQARRWDARNDADAVSARRSDRLVRLVGIGLLAATFTALAVVMSR